MNLLRLGRVQRGEVCHCGAAMPGAFKWNGREMGSESGEDGSTSGVSGKHAFMLIDTHGQAIALQT